MSEEELLELLPGQDKGCMVVLINALLLISDKGVCVGFKEDNFKMLCSQ